MGSSTFPNSPCLPPDMAWGAFVQSAKGVLLFLLIFSSTATAMATDSTELFGVQSKGFLKKGEWGESRLPGPGGEKTLYTTEVGAQAQWESKITGPGAVGVSFYRLAHPGTPGDTNVEMILQVGARRYRCPLDLGGSTSGWVDLGEFHCPDTHNSFRICVIKKKPEGNIRLASVRLTTYARMPRGTTMAVAMPSLIPSALHPKEGPLPEPLMFSEGEKARQKKAAEDLQEALDRAIQTGGKFFAIPPGHYRFPNGKSKTFTIQGANDLVVDAAGVTFWFETGGVEISDCRGVSLRGLVMDADPLPFMQGVVTGVDPSNKTMGLDFDPRYAMPVEGGKKDFFHVTFFSPDASRVIPLQWDGALGWKSLGENRFQVTEFQNNRLFTVADSPEVVFPGCRAVFSVKTPSWGVRLVRSGGCELNGVTIYGTYGFAIHERLGEGGHRYLRCTIGRRPGTGRLLANGRDGFHSYLVENGPHIEGCDFSRTMDDLVAVHGFFSLALDAKGPRVFTVVTPFEPDIQAGSTLHLLNMENGKLLGRCQVLSVKTNGKELGDAHKKVLSQRYQKVGLPIRSFTAEGESLEVTVDRDTTLSEWVGVMSEDRVARNTLIRGNYLHDNLSRGILARAHGMRIEGNRVERVAHSGIAVLPESYFLEGPFVRDLQIIGNTLEDCGDLCYNDHFFEPFIGSIHVANWFGKKLFDPPTFFSGEANERVLIQSNKVLRAASVAIFVANTRDLRLLGNTIDSPLVRTNGLANFDLSKACLGDPPVDPKALEIARRPWYGLFVMSCQNVRAQGNVVKNPPAHMLGELGIGPWVQGIEK